MVNLIAVGMDVKATMVVLCLIVGTLAHREIVSRHEPEIMFQDRYDYSECTEGQSHEWRIIRYRHSTRLCRVKRHIEEPHVSR